MRRSQKYLCAQYAGRTKLIDDSKSPNPRFRGLIHGTSVIVREEGLRGIYRGLFPVVRAPLPLLCCEYMLICAHGLRFTCIHARTDDAPGRELGGTIHDVHHPKADGARPESAGTADLERYDVRDRGDRGARHRIHDHAIRVRPLFRVPV